MSNATGATDQELVERARAGDAEAFAVVCERHRKRLWRLIASVSHGGEAEDLAQEAVVRAFCALPGYRGDAPFDAWLCRIALNVAYDHRRSAWQRRVVTWWHGGGGDEGGGCGAVFAGDMPAGGGREAHGESPEGIFARREVQRRVRAAVAALPARQRVPIWLHFFEGYTLAEVARLEQASESTLRSRVQAGLRRLSGSLEDLMDAADAEAPLSLPARAPKGCSI